MYDLIILEITQNSSFLPPSEMASFAGTEHSFRSAFELAHWIATIVWNEADQFKFLALASLLTVGVAAAVYLWCGLLLQLVRVRMLEAQDM